jgi:hypothetical protein
MVAYLCRKRSDDRYPGFGTVETLAKDFPGMNVETLRQGFDKLHESNYYLGNDPFSKDFWLRPIGEEMIQKVYPDVTLPKKEDRFISLFMKQMGAFDVTLPKKRVVSPSD